MFDISDITKKIIRRSKGISDPRIMHPVRDWWLGIMAGCLTVLVGGVYLWILHQSYYETTFISESVQQSQIPYPAELVDQAVTIIKEQQNSFSEQFISLEAAGSDSGVNDEPEVLDEDSLDEAPVEPATIDEAPVDNGETVDVGSIDLAL